MSIFSQNSIKPCNFTLELHQSIPVLGHSLDDEGLFCINHIWSDFIELWFGCEARDEGRWLRRANETLSFISNPPHGVKTAKTGAGVSAPILRAGNVPPWWETIKRGLHSGWLPNSQGPIKSPSKWVSGGWGLRATAVLHPLGSARSCCQYK